jgi:hypothetical protein
LRLLGFEVEVRHFGCYRPAFSNEFSLQRFAWMDRLGPHAWPFFGAVYFLVAVKRVRGMTLLKPGWKPARWLATASATVSVAGNAGSTSARVQNVDEEKPGVESFE